MMRRKQKSLGVRSQDMNPGQSLGTAVAIWPENGSIVTKSFLRKIFVTAKSICTNCTSLFRRHFERLINMLYFHRGKYLHFGVPSFALSIFCRYENGCSRGPSAPRPMANTPVITLVGLHRTLELIMLIALFHNPSNFLHHQPYAFISSYPQKLLGVQSRYPLLVVGHQKHQPEPLIQGDLAFVENGPSCQRNLFLALQAFINHSSRYQPVPFAIAPGAYKPLGPEHFKEKFVTRPLIRKSFLKVNQVPPTISFNILKGGSHVVNI